MSYSVKLGGVLVPCLKTLVQKASLTRNCPYKGKNLRSTGGWFSSSISLVIWKREILVVMETRTRLPGKGRKKFLASYE